MLYMSKLVKRLAMGRTLGIVALTAVLGACAAADEPTAATTSNVSPELSISSLSTTTSAVNIIAGDSSQLTATLRDRRGRILSSSRITWASSAPAVASVTSTGLVYGLSAGTTSITASSGTLAASVSVAVTPVAVASVHITPASDTLQVGESASLGTIVRSASGAQLTGRIVVWSSSNAAVASVDANGRVSALSAGAATINASVEGITATASIVSLAVTPPAPAPVATVSLDRTSVALITGQSTSLVATTRDANSTVLTGRTVTWSSSNSAVASVNGSGQVIAVAPGSAVVTATSEGKSAAATITVSAPAPVPVATVTLSHGAITVSVGQSEQVDATLKDASSNVLSGRSVTWSSSNAGIATVSSTGNVTGVAGGSATVTATSEGKTASVSVTVNGVVAPAPVATVTLDRTSVTLSTLQTTTFVATLRDANNNVLTGRSVTWSSNNISIATVGTSGNVVAIAGGAANITAASEGKSASASVTVTAVIQPPVTGFTPNRPSGVNDLKTIDFNTAGDFETGTRGSTSGFSDPTAPQSNPGVVRFVYPAGDGAGYFTGAKINDLPAGTVKVYIAYNWRLSAGFTMHPANVKTWYFYHNLTQTLGSVVVGFKPTTSNLTTGPYILNGQPQTSFGPQRMEPNVTGAPTLSRDRWVHTEILAVMNTSPTVADGILKVWVDGVLTINNSNVVYADGSRPMEWRRANLDPYYGGNTPGHTLATASYLFVDHAFIATSTVR